MKIPLERGRFGAARGVSPPSGGPEEQIYCYRGAVVCVSVCLCARACRVGSPSKWSREQSSTPRVELLLALKLKSARPSQVRKN